MEGDDVGARGPLAKPADQRRRRNPTVGFRQLVAHTRDGKPTPPWPVDTGAGKASPVEQALWDKLWALPQADEWERAQCEELVAQYVRFQCAAMAQNPPSRAWSGEVRALDATLGISPASMARLHWEIADTPTDTTQRAAQPEDLAPTRPTFTG